MVELSTTNRNEKRYMLYSAITVAVFYGILHIFTLEGLLDDPIFAKYHEQYGLFEFLYMRYCGWTSRVLLEAVTSIVLQCFTVWRILDTLMYVSLFFSIRQVMRIRGRGNILLAMLICSYIMLQMVSAGWGATSVNFMWTLAAAWACIVLWQKFSGKQKYKPYFMICYCVLMLFACNNEVTAVTMLIVYLFLLIFIRCKGKGLTGKWSKAGLYMGLVLQVVSILFFATAKGNLMRLSQVCNEVYDQLTAVGKIRIGLVSTFEHFVSIPNVIFGVFCLALAVLAWQNLSDIKARLVGTIPLVIDGVLTIYYVFRDIILGGKRNYIFAEPPMIPEQMTEWIRQWGLICLFLIVISTACYTMWKILGNSYEWWGSLLVLMAGCASRMAMAFTPSIYESGTRTFALLYFCLIAAASVLCSKVKGKWPKRIMYIVLVFGMVINATLTIIPYLQGHN